jgi:4-hydroxy-2-oxoheptanedioate aldolase
VSENFRLRLRRGDRLIGTIVAIESPEVVEVLAGAGFDWLFIDAEHSPLSPQGVQRMVMAAGDVPCVVRVPANNEAWIKHVLDAGAAGIIVPLVNNAADAAAAVAACRYPPKGIRSSGPIRALHYGGADYLAKADDEILLIAMIETREGIANLDAICATPGVDAVYIGPSDLSFALGLPPRMDNTDPLHLDTCNRILAAAHKHGKKACMHCVSAAFAADALKRGFDLVMLTSDINCMVAGARKQLDDLKAARG